MKPPARPLRGAAGEEIEKKAYTSRSPSIAARPRQIPAADVEPSWRHIGSVAEGILARIKVVST